MSSLSYKRLTEDITKGSVLRLAFLAGCNKLYDDAKDLVRTMFAEEIYDAVSKAVILMNYGHRRTLLYEDFVGAIRSNRYKFYTSKDADYKSCRSIEKLRKNSGTGCLVVTKQAVENLIRDAVKDFMNSDVRVSQSFMQNLQYYAEHCIIRKLRAACTLTFKLSGRTILKASDLLLVSSHECGTETPHPGMTEAEYGEMNAKLTGRYAYTKEGLPYKKKRKAASKKGSRQAKAKQPTKSSRQTEQPAKKSSKRKA